jgi:hypothetical protein
MDNPSTLIILGAILLGLIYYMKSLLAKNNYQVNYFFGGHLKDFPNFVRLIENEKHAKLKRKYQIVLGLIVVAIIGYICLWVFLIK